MAQAGLGQRARARARPHRSAAEKQQSRRMTGRHACHQRRPDMAQAGLGQRARARARARPHRSAAEKQ